LGRVSENSAQKQSEEEKEEVVDGRGEVY
jgi:hypothetical protein